ncbi:MAG: deoxyribose-phosphate aldolase [Acidimicrobiales bacterium]
MDLTGERLLRFEDSTACEQAIRSIRLNPPDLLGEEAILAVSSDEEDRFALAIAEAVVSVHAASSPQELGLEGRISLSSTDPSQLTKGRERLRTLLDSFGSMLADPERRAIASEGEAPNRPDPSQVGHLPREMDPMRPDSRGDLELVVRCIDLTTLRVDDTPGRVRALCSVAESPDPTDDAVGPVAAVCVYPSLVPVARESLAGSRVKVASVAGSFPSALSPLSVRVADVDAAVAAGADEVDVVINLSGLLAGRAGEVASELEEYRERTRPCALKVILETGVHPSETVTRVAAELAISAGADFLKTSTGMASVGATPDAVRVLADVIAEHHRNTGESVGLKVSGGVATAAEAVHYVSIVREVLGSDWLNPTGLRFGASKLLGDVVTRLANPDA